jgi:type VI secretion system protein ImpK
MRLSDCFMELIAYTALVVRDAAQAQLPYEQVRSNIHQLISRSEAESQQGRFAPEDFNLARFAVFAWIDETILASHWEGRQQWQREQLQRQYYQTADAGELFYEKLNNVGPHQRDVREVFYLCLSLGFTGQYCNEGDDFMLEQLRNSNLKLLTGSSMGIPSLENAELFPEAYPLGGDEIGPAAAPRRWSPFTLLCAVGPICLFGLMHLIYLFVLGNIGKNLIGTVP